MVLKTQIDASVDVSKMRETITAFDKFSLTARRSQTSWAKYGDQVKSAEKTVRGITSAMRAQGAGNHSTRIGVI